MNILFVTSGNKATGINTIVKAQGSSLQELGVNVNYFPIIGKGFIGYFKAIVKLRKLIKTQKFDIVHAHYSLSGFVAGLAGSKPLFVSLMGSDVKAKSWYKYFIKFFNFFFWSVCIVKTEDMKQTLDMGHVQVLPNGVNLDLFKPSSKATNQQKLGWDTTKQHILFPSDPSRPEKNFDLLKAAYESLNDNTVILHYLKSIDHSDIPDYLNASDVIVLPSLWEGSPNSVKEAMACSRPIICTNIGDVKWLFNNLEGHYLTDFNVGDLANKIKVALKYSLTKEKTLGREQIERLGLSSKSIAQKLINIYEQYIQKR